MEDQKISLDLLSRLCRICVVECSHMSPLFARDSDVSRKLDHMLMSCTNLKILESDGFPNSICDRCVDELKSVYGFQQRCETADRYYKQLRLNLNSECTQTETVYNIRPNYDYIEMLENNLIVFRCRECCQAFSTIRELKNHKEIHSKNKITEEKCESLNVTEPVDFTEGENEEEHLLETKQDEESDGDEYSNSSFLKKFNNYNTMENSAMDAIPMESKIKDEVLFTDNVVQEENIQSHVSNLFFEQFNQKVTKNLEVVSIPKERKKQHGGSLTVEESVLFTEKKIKNSSDLKVMKEMDVHHDNNVESSSSDDQDEDYSPSDDSDSDYFPNQTYRIGAKNQKHRNTSRQRRLPQKPSSPKTDCSRILQCAALQDHRLLHTCRVYVQRWTCSDDPKGHLHSYDSGQRLFICDVCEKSYALSINLQYHKWIHDPNKRFKCDVCEKLFVYSDDLKSHKLTCHADRHLKCDVCEKLFARGYHFRRHQLIHSANKPFKCDVCEKSFADARNLKSHKLTCHADKHLKCDVCEKLFSCSSSLRRHQWIHNANNPFKCDMCEKSFADACNLKNHKLTCHADRHLKCDVCEKLFARGYRFRRHQLIHSANKPFKCDVCEKSFADARNLKNHKLTHNTNRPFKCDVCEKSFICSWNLKGHQLTHNANKPFKCNMCKKSFSRSSYRRQHEQMHNSNKRFNCDVCGKSYRHKSTLKKHKLTQCK